MIHVLVGVIFLVVETSRVIMWDAVMLVARIVTDYGASDSWSVIIVVNH